MKAWPVRCKIPPRKTSPSATPEAFIMAEKMPEMSTTVPVSSDEAPRTAAFQYSDGPREERAREEREDACGREAREVEGGLGDEEPGRDGHEECERKKEDGGGAVESKRCHVGCLSGDGCRRTDRSRMSSLPSSAAGPCALVEPLEHVETTMDVFVVSCPSSRGFCAPDAKRPAGVRVFWTGIWAKLARPALEREGAPPKVMGEWKGSEGGSAYS